MNNLNSMLCAAVAPLLLCISGCASKPPEVPAQLRPPAGESLLLRAHATGFQDYECTAKKGSPAAYEWTFTAPDALLEDESGKMIGWHFAGPTWKDVDGSSVVGEVRAKDPGPDPTAIPWLLLATEAGPVAGAFSAVTSVQRLQTKGGIAPTDGCNEQNMMRTVRVPYTATYYFYHAS